MDEWIDGSLNHQKCTSVHYMEKKSSTLCHKWTVASIKRGPERPNVGAEDGDDSWHLINDDWCTHGYDTTCMHTLTHNGSTLMSFLSLHLLLLLSVFLCLPPSCQRNVSSRSEKLPIVLFFWPRFISHCSSSSEVMLWCCATFCNTHCSSLAALCRKQTFLCPASAANYHCYTWKVMLRGGPD